MRVRTTERRAVVLRTRLSICKNCSIEFESYIHEDRRFCTKDCYWKYLKNRPFPVERWVKTGDKNKAWKGGRQRTTAGYIVIPMPLHPLKDKHGCVPEHRLIMERHIGRYLSKKEVVHHIDGECSNNKIENLMLFKNNTEHLKYHRLNKRGLNATNR